MKVHRIVSDILGCESAAKAFMGQFAAWLSILFGTIMTVNWHDTLSNIELLFGIAAYTFGILASYATWRKYSRSEKQQEKRNVVSDERDIREEDRRDRKEAAQIVQQKLDNEKPY